jgi:hypothetical protein
VLISVGLLGLLASLDPLRPVVFVLVLQTDKGRLNAIGFFIGWSLSMAVLFAAAFVAVNASATGRASSTQKTWLSVLELILSAILMTVTLRRWQRRHDTTTRRVTPARVLRQLERLTPRRSGFLGVLIQPRSLTIAAAIIVARDRSGLADAVAGLGVFALLSTGALLALFTYVVRRPDGADSWLAGVANRIERSGPILLTLVCALASVFLLVDGTRALITG